MAKVNSVNWFEIYVQDMPRARAFYEAVLAIRLEQLKAPDGADGLEMLAFPGNMEQYGALGALCRMPGVASGQGGTLVYFACEDCAVEGARVESAGGHVVRPKMSIGEYGNIVLASDTEGNLFGLHSLQ